MDTLVLARHAFAGSNRDGLASCAVPGEGLTPEGIEQARVLRATLLPVDIALGVSSELARTKETLALALEGRDVPAIALAELNEIDFGSFADGPLDLYRGWAASHPPGEPAPGGGDSRASAAARFARGLRAVLARPERQVLLVWHALALRYVLDAAEDLPPASLIAPVEHASPHVLSSAQVADAARLLEDWSRSADPRFRDPSPGGTAGGAPDRRSSR
jgi:probable phosphoglycerate mutase